MVRVFLTHPPTARAFWYGEEALAALRALGEVVTHEGEAPLSPAELAVAAKGCAVVVIDRQTEAPAALFPLMPDLVALCRVAVDIRNIDVEAASTHGVLVCRASRGFMAAVAEWIVAMMMNAARRLPEYVAEYRAGVVPSPVKGGQILGTTVGIIGYGAIARHLAPICRALGQEVLIHDPYSSDSNRGLDELLRRSDFVVPLAVATPETENLIGARALSLMKPSAILINASRGDLVDEAALEAALDARAIAGAALDVGRAPDQMPTPGLAARPDVWATPHIGGLTPQAIAHQAMETTRQAAAILQGEAPVGAVNAEHATRLARLRA